MKLLIDNNISFKLVLPLSVFFIGTKHVRDTNGIHADDMTIWRYAKENEFVILTKDNDFDERSQMEGCPPKIVHLICGNRSTGDILNLLLNNRQDILIFGESDSDSCIMKIS